MIYFGKMQKKCFIFFSKCEIHFTQNTKNLSIFSANCEKGFFCFPTVCEKCCTFFLQMRKLFRFLKQNSKSVSPFSVSCKKCFNFFKQNAKSVSFFSTNFEKCFIFLTNFQKCFIFLTRCENCFAFENKKQKKQSGSFYLCTKFFYFFFYSICAKINQVSYSARVWSTELSSNCFLIVYPELLIYSHS